MGENTTAVREVVTLIAAAGREDALRAAVAAAVPLFQGSPGCLALTLERSVENPSQYRMIVLWKTIEDHTVGFRQSEAFGQWRELISPTVAQPPAAEHFSVAHIGF